jgi:hypothetical protein
MMSQPANPLELVEASLACALGACEHARTVLGPLAEECEVAEAVLLDVERLMTRLRLLMLALEDSEKERTP